MKILLLHKSMVLGGTEKILLNYLNMLTDRHQLTLLLMQDLAQQAFFQLPEHIDVHYAFSHSELARYAHIAADRKKNIWHKIRSECFKSYEQYKYYRAITRLIRQTQPDLIIDFSGCADKFIRLPKALLPPLPPTLRWVHLPLNSPPTLTDREYKKFHHIFQKHTAIITICRDMQQKLQALFPNAADKIHILHNTINLTEIRHQTALTPESDINTLRPYLLQVSRLEHHKGHEELIEIYSELKKQGIKHKLCFLGDGPQHPILEQKIRQLGLEQDCILLGSRHNPYPYFQHADLFLYTSEWEGLPTVLLESMACGVPVVAMDCPTGPKDILGVNSEYGCLIPMHDRTAFADAVLHLLKQPEQYQHYREQGLKRVQDFSMENIYKQLTELIQKIHDND